MRKEKDMEKNFLIYFNDKTMIITWIKKDYLDTLSLHLGLKDGNYLAIFINIKEKMSKVFENELINKFQLSRFIYIRTC